MPNETISQIQLPNGTTYDIVGKVTISRNLTSGTKSATINVDGTDYDIYSETNTDTKVKTLTYTPSQLVVFPIFGDSISSSAEEKYISYGFMGKEYNNEFGLFLGAGGSSGNSNTGYLWLNKGNYGTTLYANANLSANRTIYLPNADGTLALTSDISDTKVTQTPLNTGGSDQGLLFSKGTGASATTDTVYTSNILQWNEYVSVPKLTLYNDNGRTRYLTLKYNSITIGNSSNVNQGVIQTAALTGTRTYTLPDATGTIALTSDVHSIPSGGTSGQVLKKSSATDYAVEWGAVDALPSVSSSDNGKVLTVVSGAWAAASLPLYNGGVS